MTVFFRVEIQFNNVRSTPVRSGYRPTWEVKEGEQHSGTITFYGGGLVSPGGHAIGILQPVAPALWSHVKRDDMLWCFEGDKKVGVATVLEIYGDFEQSRE